MNLKKIFSTFFRFYTLDPYLSGFPYLEHTFSSQEVNLSDIYGPITAKSLVWEERNEGQEIHNVK